MFRAPRKRVSEADMAARKPALLRLKSHGLVDPEDDRPIELAVYDVLLPCRNFLIDHKVAVLGRTSLTTEFLLRLAKAVPGLSEEDAAAFFGFNMRETSFVLAEAEAPGYIERRDGRLWLTMAGDALFRDGSSEPEIFAVEPRRREVGFDLISLAPQRPRFLSEFELGLPELAILDEEAAGSAATQIPQAFRKFFFEIADRRERSKGEKKDLYSVDPVTSKNRFLSTVRTVVRAQASYPTSEESDLILWRPEHEQADRPEIVSAVASFVDGLKQSRSEDDGEAYNILINLAPEFLKDFTRRDGLAVERYYREAITRAGDVRADRKTALIAGSLLLAENRKRLLDVLDYGSRQHVNAPRCCFRKFQPGSVVYAHASNGGRRGVFGPDHREGRKANSQGHFRIQPLGNSFSPRSRLLPPQRFSKRGLHVCGGMSVQSGPHQRRRRSASSGSELADRASGH
jgi:hypothetical protein